MSAVVVLRPGAATTEAELRDYAAERLSYFKVPLEVAYHQRSVAPQRNRQDGSARDHRMTAELSRIVAESAIRDLLCEYTHLIDQGRLREVAALFAQSDYGQCGPDGVATTLISSDADAVFAACSGFIRMYGDPPVPRTKHLLTNTRISVDGESGDGALVRHGHTRYRRSCPATYFVGTLLRSLHVHRRVVAVQLEALLFGQHGRHVRSCQAGTLSTSRSTFNGETNDVQGNRATHS